MKKICTIVLFVGMATQNLRALTLEECLQKALGQNRSLLAGRARLEAERSKIRQARAAFYPTLSLSTGYTRLGNIPGTQLPAFPPLIPASRELTFGFKDNYLSRLSLYTPIFTWGRISGPYRIQQEAAKVESLKLARAEEEVKLTVTELFWAEKALEKNLEVRQKTAESLERHLQTVENKLSVGQASNFEQLRAKVELTNARVPIKETEAQLKVLRDRLRNFLGLPPDSDLQLEGELVFQPVAVVSSEAVEKARQNRTELKELEVQKMVLERSQALAESENRPSLFVTSNAEYKNPFNAQKIWKFDWNAGAGVTFPFFTGFHSRYKAEEIEHQKKALDLSRREAEAQIELEVRQALYDLEVAAEASAALKDNVGLAQRALEIARAQYEAGVITNQDELDAELASQAAETAYLAAVSGHLIARARLEKAAGAPIE